jgi:thiol-disulfide isomerase/thioredoxin
MVVGLLGIFALGCKPAKGAENAAEGKPAAPTRIEVGLPAPAYAAITMNGDSVNLASHRGHVVLLNIWATWCIPCRVEVPVIERLHQRYGPKGLDVIGVSVDVADKKVMIENFTKTFGVTYDIWRDTKSGILDTYRAIGVPATFIIGRDGVLLFKYLGPIPEGDTQIHRMIEQGLAQ